MANSDTNGIQDETGKNEEVNTNIDVDNVSGTTTLVPEDAGEDNAADVEEDVSKPHETEMVMPEGVSSKIKIASNDMLPPKRRFMIIDWARENPALTILLLPQLTLTTFPLILLVFSFVSIIILSTTLALLLTVLSITIPLLFFAAFAAFIITPIIFVAAAGGVLLSLSGFFIYRVILRYQDKYPNIKKFNVQQDGIAVVEQIDAIKQTKPNDSSNGVEQQDPSYGKLEQQTGAGKSPVERRKWSQMYNAEQDSQTNDVSEDGILREENV